VTPFRSVSGAKTPLTLLKEANVVRQQRENANQAYGSSSQERKEPVQETEWAQVKEDCCDTEDGRKKPSLTALFELAVSGESLAVVITAQHACGIRAINLDLRILEPGDDEPWTKEAVANFDCPGDNKPIEHTFKWGKPPHRLPVNLINCLVTATISATSCCSTSEMINIQTRLKS
jgi:hypothetical protein